MKPKLWPPDCEQSELTITTQSMNTLAHVILSYWRHASVQKRTSRNNALSVLKILERVKGHPVKSENVPLSEINEELIRVYQRSTVDWYQSLAAKDEASQREAKERALRSTKSTITQARSIFSRRGDVDLLRAYKDDGIEIPDSVLEFASCRVSGKAHRSNYVAAPDSVVEKVFESIELMRRDRSVYLAFWLASGALLRRKEIHNCRWEHIVEIEGEARVQGGIGKNGEQINVPIQEKAYEKILPFRQQVGYVIPERSDKWCRRLCDWMREEGFKTRLLLHEIRAIVGSKIYRKDPVAAKMALRHRSIVTTEKNYGRYVKSGSAVNVL